MLWGSKCETCGGKDRQLFTKNAKEYLSSIEHYMYSLLHIALSHNTMEYLITLFANIF